VENPSAMATEYVIRPLVDDEDKGDIENIRLTDFTEVAH
jgi:hypothetical protein